MRRAQAGTSGHFPVTGGPDDGGCRAAWGAQVQGVRVRRERRLWEARESPGLLHSLCGTQFGTIWKLSFWEPT